LICLVIFSGKIIIDNVASIALYKLAILIIVLGIFYILYFFFYTNMLLVIERLIDNGTKKEMNNLHVYLARVINVLNLLMIPITLLFLFYCIIKQHNPYIL
jgi:flagellar biosynthesis protein FlhB